MRVRHPITSAVCALLLTNLSAACAEQEDACSGVDGLYQALYTPVSGDCGPIAYQTLAVDGTRPVNTSIQMLSTQNVTTEVILKGCAVRMTQTVADKTGKVLTQIDAGSLQVRDASELAGQITYAVYDEMSQLACYGTYHATYVKMTTTIGGAAE